MRRPREPFEQPIHIDLLVHPSLISHIRLRQLSDFSHIFHTHLLHSQTSLTFLSHISDTSSALRHLSHVCHTHLLHSQTSLTFIFHTLLCGLHSVVVLLQTTLGTWCRRLQFHSMSASVLPASRPSMGFWLFWVLSDCFHR